MNNRTNKQTFDVCIIGSGSAGLAAAESAKEAGAKRIAVIEGRKRLGGECPNRGCVPTKSLLRSVEILMLSRRAKEFGLRFSKLGFYFPSLMRRKRKIVDVLTGGSRLQHAFQKLGVTLIRGTAFFTGSHSLDVNGEEVLAKKFIIATGSETFIPPIRGLKESGFWTSDDIVDIPKPPKSLIVIGGGPIGLEWAQILAPLGTKITIVEFLPQLLPREDSEIATIVMDSFKKQRIEFFVNTKVTRVQKKGRKFLASLAPAKGGKERLLEADALLIAAGKRAAVSSLDLEAAGVKQDERGNPVLNPYLQTSNPNIFAAGDAAGQMMFTHVAHLQGEIAGENAVKGPTKKSDLSVIPRGTFCFPEVGSVGMTEQEVRSKGLDVSIGRGPYSYLGKSLVSGEMEGLVKIIADKKTGQILGGHVVGESAVELIHEIALAMFAKIPIQTVAKMVHAYPTYSEAVGLAAFEI